MVFYQQKHNILEYKFGIEYEMICQINNDNLNDNINEYYQSLYSTPASYITSAWTTISIPQPTIVFIENGIGTARIDICLCEYNTEYEISNGMSDIIILV